MNRFLASFLALLGIGASAQGPKPNPAVVMAELRAKALSVRPNDIGLAPSQYQNGVWGVLMETGLENGAVYSLVIIADGTTSLYFSTGGGVIGAGEHSTVRAASTDMLHLASRLRSDTKPTVGTPLPGPSQVVFYLLADKGTLTYSATEKELAEGKHHFSSLFFAGQNVISEVRKAEESLHRSPSK